MNGIELSDETSKIKDIKALLSLNFRIALYVKGVQVGPKETPGVGETIEYHFVRDKQYDDHPDTAMSVNCVLCKSRIGDSLKLCGLKRSFADLQALFQNQRLTGNYTLFFERYRIAVFPYDWYACFEKNDPNDSRWKEIETTIKMLPAISAELATKEELEQKRKRDKEEATKREKEEEERKKRDEENRKREESRKKMEELAKSLEIVAKAEDNPDDFANFMNNMMNVKKK